MHTRNEPRSSKPGALTRITTALMALPVACLLFASQASAQVLDPPQIFASNQACPADQPGAPNNFVCTSNDITLTLVQLTNLVSCTEGTVVSATFDIDLSVNANIRYNPMVWISQNAIDPTVSGSICYVSSVPDGPLTHIPQLLFADANVCADIDVPSNNFVLDDLVLGPIDFQCEDTDGDGKAEIPIIVTWENSPGAACGPGDYPINQTPSKCDAFTAETEITVIEVPGLNLAKAGVFQDESGDNLAQPGETVDYTLTVENTGNVALTNVLVADPLIEGPPNNGTISCPGGNPIPSLAVAASVVCTATYAVTQADIDFGAVLNTATATSGAEEATANANVPLPQAPAIQVVKAGTPNFVEPPQAGDTISYTFDVTNTGNLTLTNVTVADTIVTTVICPGGNPIPSLAPTATVQCQGNYTLTQADIDSGSVSNTVTATAEDPNVSDTDDDTQPLTQDIELTLLKTATPQTYNAVSQNIAYDFLLTNTGNVTLSAPFGIVDDVSADESCPPTPTSLAPGESITCTATHTITQADIDAGSVTNTAQGSAVDPAAQTVNSNTDQETITAVITGSLGLVKTATPSTYDTVGDVISYSYLLTNGTNITLYPPYAIADDKSVDESCPNVPASLAPGQQVTCSASYTISQVDLDAGAVTNTATGTAQDGGGQTYTSNEDSETVTAEVTGSLGLVKTATPQTYDTVGDVISYSYELTNNTNITLYPPYTIDDDQSADESCPDVPASLAPGASVTCTASYTIAQADLDARSVVNVATGTAQNAAQGGQTVTSNQDTETVTAEITGGLTLVKTATPQTYTAAGEVISYSYLLTNNTNITLYPPYTIADNLSTDENCPAAPASLAPGASVTCTASYTITAPDVDARSVTNLATGTAQDAAADGQTVTSNQDSETVTLLVQGTLQLIKSANPQTYSTVGTVINYTYALTNGTNVPLYPPYVIADDIATDENCPAAPASLEPAATVNCTATHTITQADIDAGFVTNVATGTAQDAPADGQAVTSNQDTETVTAVRTGSLSLVKTATPQTYAVIGDVISYSYLLTNGYNITLYPPFAIDDDVSTDENCPQPASLAPGASITCTASHTITSGDIDAESVVNVAFGTALDAPADGQTVQSNNDTETVTLLRTGSLNLVKTASPLTYIAEGEVISYSYLLTNNTNITLHAPYAIDDDRSTDETCPDTPASIAPTESVTCTATYTITAADVTAGSVTNTATGSAFDAAEGGQLVQSNEDSATVNAVLLNLSKTAAAPTFNPVTGRYTVVYTITATNAGTAAGTYDLTDTFSPAAGITLFSAVINYAGGETQTGTPAGPLPYSFSSGETVVTGEGLAGGATEQWTITAVFDVDPTQVDDNGRACVVGQEQAGQGFYNSVSGGIRETDPDDNDACTNLPDPSIDLSKTAADPSYNGNGSYTVVYTITASNVGQGPGYYDLTDTIDPGNGITVTQAQLTAYNAGTEDSQSGVLAGPLPYTFSSGATVVTAEALAAGRDESWTLTVEFAVVFDQTDETLQCSDAGGGAGTGFYNRVEGSASDPDPDNNDACVNPSGGSATFRVTKDFLDNNDGLVNVHIRCNTGLPLEQDFEIADISTDEGVGFVVTSFEPGQMDCEIYEVPVPAGYEDSYTAGYGDAGIADRIGASGDGCAFEGIIGGGFTCEVTNTPQPVDVTVFKVWDLVNQGSDLALDANVTIWCDAPIEGGTQDGDGGYWFRSFDLLGDDSAVAVVTPDFPSSRCWAVESNLVSEVEAINECGESYADAQLIVSVGQGDECTITNTVFFEGIPTLSQYGLALLALLTLGVGLLATRRFV